MRQPDRKQFLKAMQEEVEGQTKNGNWSIVPRTEVPQGSTILPAVWAMRRKRRIDTREVYKWNARLTKGINYWETYAPVAAQTRRGDGDNKQSRTTVDLTILLCEKCFQNVVC
jgi:hypothetical protein